MKHEFAAVDVAAVIRKLKRSLKSARTRAEHWREQAKAIDRDWKKLAAQQHQIILNQRSRIDALQVEREELQAYNRVLQWRVNSESPSLAQSAQGQQQFNQMQQNVANLQNYSQEQFGQDFCTCVPARHNALIR